MASYYILILPIGPLISSIGILYNHIIILFQWMTFYRRPGHLSPRIAMHFVNMLILIPILFLIGTISGAVLLPDFNARLHLPLFVIFILLMFLIFFLVRASMKNRISRGKKAGCSKCEKWSTWFFHIYTILPNENE